MKLVAPPTDTVGCPQCGTHFSSGDTKWCPGCGLPIVCRACGVSYADPLEDLFCAECGEPVRRSDKPLAAESPEREADAGTGAGATGPAGPEAVAPSRASGAGPRDSGRQVSDLAKGVVGVIGKKGKEAAFAGAARARNEVRPVWWQTRGGVPRSSSDLRLALCISLLREVRDREIEQEVDAVLVRALTGPGADPELLGEVARAATGAGARGPAIRAWLELAVRQPGVDGDAARTARRLLTGDKLEGLAGWIINVWFPEARRSTAGINLAESALTACRAAIAVGDGESSLEFWETAVRADRDRVIAAEPELLGDQVFGGYLEREPAGAHALRGRMLASLGRHQAAIVHLDAALSIGSADPATERELLELMADCLTATGRQSEAAAVLLETGRRYDLVTLHSVAVERFRRATELDDGNAPAHWYLADSARLSSGRSEFPYVDVETITLARAHWERGMRLERPAPGQAWVHLCGALIYEAVSRIGSDADLGIANAAVQAEAAVALDCGSSDGWALAARYHRMLGYRRAADQAARRAVELDGENRSALWEQAVIAGVLVAPGARELLASFGRRFAAAHDTTLLCRRARLLILDDDLPGARSDLAEVLATDPGDVWAAARLALCDALAGSQKAAQQQASAALDQMARRQQRFSGWIGGDERPLAALLAGRFDVAAAAFASGSERISAVDRSAGAAAAFWLRGEHERALAQFSTALDQVADRGDAGAVLVYLRLLERSDAAFPDALGDLIGSAAARFAEDEPDLQPVDQALAELEDHAAKVVDDDARWIAGVAGEGRVLEYAGRWQHAGISDERLLRFGDPVLGIPGIRHRLARVAQGALSRARKGHDPEGVQAAAGRLVELGELTEAQAVLELAGLELERGEGAQALASAERALAIAAEDGADDGSAARALVIQGDVHAIRGAWPEAERRYVDALKNAGGEFADPFRARIDAGLAVAAASRDDLTHAVEHLEHAIRCARAVMSPGASARLVIGRLAELTGDDREPPALPAAVRRLIESPSLSKSERRRVAGARFGARRAATATTALQPVDEITVDGGLRILPVDDAAQLADDAIPAIRHRLREATGVRIPGVRVRRNPLLGDWDFRLSINEIPYLSGNCPAAGMLLPGSGADGASIVNPWTGETAVWIAEASEPGALPADRALAWLLEGLLHAHIAEFVALAEVEYHLNAWGADGGPDRSILLKETVPSSWARTRLVAVLRRLVRQQVCVEDLGSILRAVGRFGSDRPLVDIAEQARAELVELLPRAGAGREVIEVEPEIQAAIGAIAAAPAASAAHKVLDRLQCALGGRAPGQFIAVVDDAETRVPAQHLCERLVPSAAVLTRRELHGLGERSAR